MNRLIRFYNQNRKDVWKVIGIIVVIIIILQLLNYHAKNKENNNTGNYTNNSLQYDSVDLETKESVLSGEKLSEEKQESIKIIDNFFKYCNEQKIQEAYDLLTEECKEEMYSSIEDFKEMYCDKVLEGQNKNISVENWTDNIYKVTISEDFISTGKYSEENNIQDYITIKDDKLNINSYIGRKVTDNEKEENDINIKIIKKDIYMDYLKYTFEITNNSEGSIILDPLENIDTMYIKDSNGMKYSAYTHELSQAQLIVGQGEKKQVSIKYYSKYSSNRIIKKVIFSRMILNYNQVSNSGYYKFEI